jgi:hypothetical protein
MIMISRWKWLIPVLALACCWPGLALAATIDWYASGFYSESRAQVATPGETADSGIKTDQNPDLAATKPSASVTNVIGSSDNSGEHYSLSDGTRNVAVRASVYGSSNDTGGTIQVYGNANTLTLTPTNTDGIFFLINPSAGEKVGDPVTLRWNWNGTAQTFDGATASLTGGYNSPNMAITLTSGLAPAQTIWSYAGQVLSEKSLFDESDQGEHLALIGDIIGIYLGASTGIDISGSGGDYFAVSNQTFDLAVDTLPVPIPGAVWLLGTGLVGLAGLRRKLGR